MRKRLLTVAAALGLTTICLAQLIQPLVSPTHTLVYHWSGRASALFGPAVIDIAIAFLLVAMLLISAERKAVWRSAVWVAIILFLPWILFHEVQQMRLTFLPHWFHLPRVYFAIAAYPVLVWIFSRAAKYREAVFGAANAIFAFMALSGLIFVAQILLFWWNARALNQPLPLHASTTVEAAAKPKPRIIWILMDELSYQQVYEHRYPGLQLPAFDALAAESTVFSDVSPAANYTDKAVPGLLSGRVVDYSSSTANGMLLVRSAGDRPWQIFDERATVFQDALNDGYRTRVAGWYNPYCRILHDVLDSCFWADPDSASNGLAPDGSFHSNLVSSADTLLGAPTVRHVLHIPERFEGYIPDPHILDYEQVEPQADMAVLDSSSTFTFVHLPIPHPIGIYNRRTDRLTTKSSSYIDNLALADQCLAHIHSLLEQTGQWDSSTILVMGDHGWRTTLLWKSQPGWTEEDERASMGKFDTRPAYIVKLAGQTAGTRIDKPFDAVRTRALIDAVMTGSIRSSEDLKGWADGLPTSLPTADQQVTAERGADSAGPHLLAIHQSGSRTRR